ncbi:cell wall integrity and stress response component 2 [Gouania willdenowi]|uniref:cell wall integrity and stress response component 2 n=1 Tax=Gouania willdenowi TaxID=441366 RepID=UPI0010542798|nr:cell wall integrity and stress response component 2-like [Gouania willdenowi]
MMTGFPSSFLMWLLPLMASNTLLPFYNFTNVTTKFQHALTTKGAPSRKSHHITPASTVTVNPIEEDNGSQSSLQKTQTNPFRSSFESKTSTPGVQTTVMRTTAMITTQDCNSTKLTEASTMQSNATHSTRDRSTNGSIHTPQVTTLNTTSTDPEEIKSENTRPFTGEGVTPELTSPYQHLVITQVVDITKIKQPSQNGNKPHEKRNHSKVIAGIICGTLALMVAGFVLIYIKKRKIKKQQLTTNDWAGPSPFLNSGAHNGQIALQTSNRISLASFLPQRLSKRLSLLPEAHEDMVNINLGSTFGQVVDGDKLQETNAAANNIVELKPSGHIIDTSASLQTNSKSEIQTNQSLIQSENQPQ